MKTHVNTLKKHWKHVFRKQKNHENMFFRKNHILTFKEVIIMLLVANLPIPTMEWALMHLEKNNCPY